METVAIFPSFKIENRSFSLHCPDFIRGPILLCLWSDLSEIFQRVSSLTNLHYERLRLKFDFKTVVFLVRDQLFELGDLFLFFFFYENLLHLTYD